MKPPTKTYKTKDKPISTAYIPYTQETYGGPSRMLAKHNIPLLYHRRKYPATSHLSRMPWDREHPECTASLVNAGRYISDKAVVLYKSKLKNTKDI
jgi:hypothetical protein